jgi:hypothetical protein
VLSYEPTRDAAKLLIAAGTGQASAGAQSSAVGVTVLAVLTVALGAFWFAARSRDCIEPAPPIPVPVKAQR